MLKRDVVFKQIIDGTLLNAAMETDIGKHVLRDAVTLMSDAVTQLIEMCRNDARKNFDAIVQQAHRVQDIEEILKRWAETISNERTHRVAAKGGEQ